MIYLVSNNNTLFESNNYKKISCKDALQLLDKLKLIQLDSETSGLDCHTKVLLTLQLGNKDNQIVFDWTTISNEDKSSIKKFLESEDKTWLAWNAAFDLTFLYVQHIYPKNIIDGMILDKLIFLGYPPSLTPDLFTNQFGYKPVYDANNVLKHYELSYSLKAAADRWIHTDIDKSVRGQIITKGLTDSVVVYAANDVRWLEDIYNEQLKELTKQDLLRAAKFECEFIKSVAYTKYCGIHLDADKWKAKMKKDQNNLQVAIKELNNYVVNLYNKDKSYKAFTTYVQPDLFGFTTPGIACNINWSSSKQVIPLFEQLGIQVKTFDKKTRKEKKSIEEKQLAPQSDKFPIIPLFLRYQGASKLVSTYGDNWLKAINPKTGRIHLELHSIGTDTSRMSSGGGVYKLNAQNLPNDAETRACFTAEEGNSWLSCDYKGQESCLIASVSKDKAMIKELSKPNGDIHSLVAYMSYPSIIPRNTPIENIKKEYHDARQNAKGIEFSINYGGDAHTIANNKGISIKEAEKIYNDFMKGFPGIHKYQQYCRNTILQKGYILMNPILGHRAHLYDGEWLKKMSNKMEDPEFVNYYWQMRKLSPNCDTVKDVNRFNKRKAASEKQSINYRIQNRGACCFKLASIKLFNWIVNNNYQDKVLMCVPAHDEWNLECPKDMQDIVGKVLVQCMVAGGRPFCPNVFLGADLEISDHWVH